VKRSPAASPRASSVTATAINLLPDWIQAGENNLPDGKRITDRDRDLKSHIAKLCREF
jgi:hypothetical protein